MQGKSTTAESQFQIPDTKNQNLSDLRQALFFLGRYRTKAVGRKKSDTVDTLVQAIGHLQQAEGEPAP